MTKRNKKVDPIKERRNAMLYGGRDSQWPIDIGSMMETPVFYPSEEEFSDFYAYVKKLDRLVGHIGVCKIVPPAGWKPRAHDVYSLQDSTPELEEAVTVKRPIKQNAIGGKGLYMNMHEEKRSMKLSEFKRIAQSKAFAPPIDGQKKVLDRADIDLLERQFWKNVLFNPPMYGADCPAPKGMRSDGREGLFDPAHCGDWDVSLLPSLLSFGLKKRVPGVNTPFIYVGMYRAAFAWHCEDMDLHSINYLHWGAPKTWYSVPATHGHKLEALARKHFPTQAEHCKEFLRHKSNMMEPSILLKAEIPLTRTVQYAGEFVINFPGAYHSGFNNGYNCAESCNFATEYWVPFGCQAKPCSCAGGKDSVRIDVDAMLRKVKDVKIKGVQWVQCDKCSKWRLLPPYMMHLLCEDDPFECSLIEGISCATKEQKNQEDGGWEVDGKMQIGLDPDKEEWVMCENCSKWRKIPEGVMIDAEAVFVCQVLKGVTCDDAEEEWADAEEGSGWQLLDIGSKGTRQSEWSKEDEERFQVRFLKEELSAYSISEGSINECGEDKAKLEELLERVKSEWKSRWDRIHARWQEERTCKREGGLLASKATLSSATAVAQKLWMLAVDLETMKESERKVKDQERRKRKQEALRAEEARFSKEFTDFVQSSYPELAFQDSLKHEIKTPTTNMPSSIQLPERAWRYHPVNLTVIAFSPMCNEALCQTDDKLMQQLKKMLSPVAKDVALFRFQMPQPTAPDVLPPLSLNLQPNAGMFPPIALGNPFLQGSLACAPGAQPVGIVVPWRMVYLKPIVRGSKEAALLDALLSSPSPTASSPCAVLVKDVNVCVGYWRELQAEYTGKLESYLAKIAGRFVADKLVEMLVEANRNGVTQSDAHADFQISSQRSMPLDFDSLVGRRGLLHAQEDASRGFWEKVRNVQLRWNTTSGDKYVLFPSPALPPSETKAQPPRPVTFGHEVKTNNYEGGMSNGHEAVAGSCLVKVKEERDEAVELS